MTVGLPSALSRFLSAEARSSVVRIREVESAESGVFTGFFISPFGHLITAFHAVKAYAINIPGNFPIEMSSAADGHSVVRTVARWEPGWFDPYADWAVIQLDVQSPTYLPIAAPGTLTGHESDLCAPVRVYGFTIAHDGPASLGALNGEYLRNLPERGRFRLAFSVRSKGQSGGPVIDLRTLTAVGSVVGFRDDEMLTADAARLDQAILGRVGLDVDLGSLATAFRRRCMHHLGSTIPEFAELASEPGLPGLPEPHLSGRTLVRTICDQLRDRAAIVLHGPPGSGKTTVSVEAARALVSSKQVDCVFWHDFGTPGNLNPDRVLRRLALHLLERQGSLEPIEACIDDGFAADHGSAASAVVDVVRRGRQLLVFDNFHTVARENRPQTVALMRSLLSAVRQGESLMILASWDLPVAPFDVPVISVGGFSPDEVSKFLDLYDVSVSARALAQIAEVAEDITSVEQFVRSPELRRRVEFDDLRSQAEDLRQLWRQYPLDLDTRSRSVLLALAVLEKPASRSVAEATAGVNNFAACVRVMQDSPPLVHVTDDRYYLHTNVAIAVLGAADRDAIQAARYRGAQALIDEASYTDAARLLLAAGDRDKVVNILYEYRENIIAQIGAGELERLAMSLTRRLGPDSPNIYPLHAILASCYHIRGNYEQAIAHWHAAVLLSDSKTVDAAAMLNRKADSLRLASRYDEASREYEHAATAARALPGGKATRELGQANLGLAKLRRLHADYGNAHRLYREAQTAFEQIFDEKGLVETDFGAGEVYRLTSQFPAAKTAYQRSLERSRAIRNDERAAYALWGIGEVLRLTGELASAEAAHREGLELCLHVGDTRSEGWALLGLAETFRAGSRLQEAEAAGQEALSRFAQTRSETEEAHARFVLAEVDRTGGAININDYIQVLRIYQRNELRHCKVQCLTALAAAMRTAGRGRGSARPLRTARKLARRLGLLDEMARIEKMLADPTSAPMTQLNFP